MMRPLQQNLPGHHHACAPATLQAAAAAAGFSDSDAEDTATDNDSDRSGGKLGVFERRKAINRKSASQFYYRRKQEMEQLEEELPELKVGGGGSRGTGTALQEVLKLV